MTRAVWYSCLVLKLSCWLNFNPVATFWWTESLEPAGPPLSLSADTICRHLTTSPGCALLTNNLISGLCCGACCELFRLTADGSQVHFKIGFLQPPSTVTEHAQTFRSEINLPWGCCFGTVLLPCDYLFETSLWLFRHRAAMTEALQ
jgi:hypothetical protein